MPTYIYRDVETGEEFEYFQSMNDKPLEFWPEDIKGFDPDHPRKVVRKIGGGSGFILKGSGWYKTDFATKKPAVTPASPEPKATEDAPAPSASGTATDSQ